MLITYLVVSSFLGIALSLIWTSKDWPNAVIKICLISWTVWSLLLLAGSVWPFINNGSVKLI